MASKSTARVPPLRYSAAAKLMHWFVAISVITLLIEGPVMKRLVPESPIKDSLYLFHEGLGALMLLVMVVRLARRVAFGLPAPDPGLPPAEQRASLAAQHALYL